MAWTTPPDFIAGTVVTEAQLDALSALLTTGVTRPLAEVILAAPAATIDFQSIPATFRNLSLTINARGTNASTTSNMLCRMNNVTTITLYHTQGGLFQSSSTGYAEYAGSLGGIMVGAIPAASAAAAQQFGSYVVTIPDYLNTTSLKTAISIGSLRFGSAAAGSQQTYILGGTWDSTAAINRLTLFPDVGNFATGSKFTLYGEPFI